MTRGSGGLLIGGVTAACAVALVAALLGVSGCGEAGRHAEDGQPRVVATILPLANLAQQILSDAGDVEVLLPPGRSPHGFEMTANHVRRLAEAEVLLAIGGGVDTWATRLARDGQARAHVIEMHALIVEALDLDDDHHHDHDHDHGHDHGHDHHHHGPVNPHHWLDPLRVAMFVEHVGDALAERYPTHGESIRANTAELLTTIEQVDREHAAALADLRVNELITFHNAFDPLAARYGLNVVAHLTPIELTPGGEVTPSRLRAALAAIERYELPVIYAEPQFPEQAVAALRDQAGVVVLRLDPIGHPRRDGYDSWQAMMRSNLQTLVDGQNRAR